VFRLGYEGPPLVSAGFPAPSPPPEERRPVDFLHHERNMGCEAAWKEGQPQGVNAGVMATAMGQPENDAVEAFRRRLEGLYDLRSIAATLLTEQANPGQCQAWITQRARARSTVLRGRPPTAAGGGGAAPGAGRAIAAIALRLERRPAASSISALNLSGFGVLDAAECPPLSAPP